MKEDEMNIAREDLMNLWISSDMFRCFPWETIKRVASNPEVKDVHELENVLNKIVANRSKK